MDLQKYVSLDNYLPAEGCLHIKDELRCREDCSEKKCAYICPAGIFEITGRYPVLHSDRVCLECGACRLICDNVVFHYPEAGRGVINHFG